MSQYAWKLLLLSCYGKLLCCPDLEYVTQVECLCCLAVLQAPRVPVLAEDLEMKKLINTYGKTFHTWQVDRGDTLPLGTPIRMHCCFCTLGSNCSPSLRVSLLVTAQLCPPRGLTVVCTCAVLGAHMFLCCSFVGSGPAETDRNVVPRFDCPQTFPTLNFQCRADVSELNRRFGIVKSSTSWHRLVLVVKLLLRW